MNTNTNVNTEVKTRYVIDGRTGMRMTYEEWLDMRRSELN